MFNGDSSRQIISFKNIRKLRASSYTWIDPDRHGPGWSVLPASPYDTLQLPACDLLATYFGKFRLVQWEASLRPHLEACLFFHRHLRYLEANWDLDEIREQLEQKNY